MSLTLIVISFVFSLTHLSSINQITKATLLSLYQLIPNLLPLMLLFLLANSLGLFYPIGYFLQPIFRNIFHIDCISSTLFLSSFFSGFPTNIKIIKNSYRDESISLQQLNHLLKIASCPSFSFIVVVIGKNVFNSLQAGYFLYFIQVLSNLLLAFLIRPKEKPEKITLINIKEKMRKLKSQQKIIALLSSSFLSCFQVFVIMYGFMLVFNIQIYILSSIISNQFLLAFLHALLEFTQGIPKLSIFSYPVAFGLTSFFLSFTSLSIIFQSTALLEDIDYTIQDFFLYRVKSGILSIIIHIFFFCI